MRRGLTAGVAALALALAAVPAHAATPIQTSIQGAEATWYFDRGGVATGVLIRPVQERDAGPGSTKKPIVGVNVQVQQEYIDPATGEDVFRAYVSDPYYSPATSIAIDALKGASVHATVKLYGEPPAAGPYTVDVTAAWTPTGGRTHALSSVWDTEFGAWSLNRTNESSVPAVATGSLTGAFDFGSLGETQGVLRTAHSFAMFRPPAMQSPLSGMVDVAAAEARSTYHITGATSDWVVGDARNTEILLSVEQNHNASGGTSGAIAWLEVYGGYCDTATDESVWFDLFSDTIPAPLGSVDPSLQRATVTATFSVTGAENRTPGCEEPTGETTVTAVGPSDVTVAATWSATGALTHFRKLFIEQAPDYTSKDRYYSRARQAAATGTVSSILISATLTNVQNAFMYDETHSVTTK